VDVDIKATFNRNKEEKMKQYRRLVIALAIFLSGAALIPYVSLSSEPFGWQMFADAYVPDQPALAINYQTGQPGSFFTLTGSNFAANAMSEVSVNGSVLGNVTSDSGGELLFLLTTSNADEGFYAVTASANPSASAGFLLDSVAPLRSQEDSGTEFDVPAGISLTEFLYLPIIYR
jgi:hypothetical protein